MLEEWDDEKNLPFTSETISHTSSLPVWWKCEKGHSWQTQLRSRSTTLTRCPKCLEEELAKKRELAKGDGSQKTAVASDAMLTYDVLIIDAACYNIDGNNYFKLRDITDALDCRVEWNERTQQIEISTMTPAKEDPNEIKG